jgi:hypothetical protein
MSTTISIVRIVWLLTGLIASISTSRTVSAWVQQQQQLQPQQPQLKSHPALEISKARYLADDKYSKTALTKHCMVSPQQHQEYKSTSPSTGTCTALTKSIRSIVTATAFLTMGWWCSTILPLPTSTTDVLDNSIHHNFHYNNRNVANAKEMASGSGSRVNKDPESLLRYGLPIQNKEVRASFLSESCIIE